MTNQEMFNLAARGLREQKFQRSMSTSGLGCVYDDGNGKRCAWGHVDSSLTFEVGSIYRLHENEIGLAASLTPDSMRLAIRLQLSHDFNGDPADMYHALKSVADHWNLSDEELGPQP